jgi:folate-binding protein YgfZ
MTLDFAETTEALARGVVGRVVPRDVVWVEGPDAKTYLQGQITQDLDGLAPGRDAEALVLSPQGKIDGYVRVVMVSDERFGLEIEHGFGGAIFERLRRFKIRVKAILEVEETTLVEVRGPKAIAPPSLLPGTVLLRFGFTTLTGFDLLGRDAVMPEGVQTGDEGAFEVARILAGVPRMGRELTDKTIPAEAGLVERTVSFTKGCYTGQELVARLDSRGNRVPWNLRAVRIDGDAQVAPGDVATVGDDEVGRITSAAYSPVLGASVALGYLKRSFEPPGAVRVVTARSTVDAEVTALPDSTLGRGPSTATLADNEE